jgi:prephenate dehydratase
MESQLQEHSARKHPEAVPAGLRREIAQVIRERPLPTVAFQGEHGAFSEEALLGHFGGCAEPIPRRDFQGVGEAVLTGDAELGILPVENTLAGSVQGSHDVLVEEGLTIVGEIVIPIRLFLLGVPGAREDDLRRVLSHPVALAQCSRYLRARPRLEAVAVHDTAGAALEVARQADVGMAAVAPRAAAERYGLTVLAADLQDRDDNQTRFYLVQREGCATDGDRAHDDDRSPDPEARFRTVVLLELEDRPGALLAALQPFASSGIDLSRVESRPGRSPWRYRFLFELRGRADAPRVREALSEASRTCTAFRVLGSFLVAASMHAWAGPS